MDKGPGKLKDSFVNIEDLQNDTNNFEEFVM